jgi:MarR family transcriptional regulator, 2-MHQ and catechol-resistance regulon repressor
LRATSWRRSAPLRYLDIKLYDVVILVSSETWAGAMTPRRSDRSGIHTWLVLMKAHRTLTRHAVRSIEALDMGLSDFAILEALLHKGPQAVSELGRRIDLTSGSMTTAIDRLERRRLVKRTDHATDRRAWVIHLTPEGKALIAKVFARHEDAMERAMRGLSRTERATLTDLLRQLGTTAEEQLTRDLPKGSRVTGPHEGRPRR